LLAIATGARRFGGALLAATTVELAFAVSENRGVVAEGANLPEGRVTFLFTDVEGSTQLLERHPADYGRQIGRHHELLEGAVKSHGGIVFETIGDAVYAAFTEPAAAVEAATHAQLSLAAEDWSPLEPIRVRMGLHTGEVERRGAHYFGPALYRCARLTGTAHGGQVVLSEATASLTSDRLGGDTSLIDLGLHRLKDLREPERVYQLAHPGLESEFAPLRTAEGRPNNLPSDVKTFVGRQDELDSLHELLVSSDVRIVTLTGAGGSGKTRLALRAAEGLLEPFRDGVFLVDLAPLAQPYLVLGAIAGVLGVPPATGRSVLDSLSTHLAGKEVLLVLDNFEHVLAAAPDIAAIAASAPHVRLLTTSRAPLRIQGEHEFHVDPLPLPEADADPEELMRSPAVQLFVERAREIRGDFGLTAENADAIAEITRRLDGLPLAIELAAARTRLLPPAALLERLEDRLGLLAGGPSDAPARQRTLRDTIAWSYDLLDEGEEALLRRLGIFHGGCSLDAAEGICGDDVLSGLTVLAEQNLVVVRWNDLGEPRYELLETIAEFARERLAESGERDDLACRHAAYFADLAEAAEPALYSDARGPWLLRLDEDRDNIRAALAWSADRDEASVGLRILASLWLWWWTAFPEGLAWADRVLELPSGVEPTPIRAGALFTAEICWAGAGDLPVIRRYAEEAISVSRAACDDRRLALAQALGAGALAGLTPSGEFSNSDQAGGPEKLRALSEEAIEIGQSTGEPWVTAWTKMISGLIAVLAGDPATARSWASEAQTEFEELHDSWSRASASMSLAFALLQLGELEDAHAALDGSVPALLEVGDLKMASGCEIAYGLIARFGGRGEDAERHYGEALTLCVRAGDPANAPICMEGIAAAMAHRDPQAALRLLGAARALFDAGNIPAVPGFEAFYGGTWAALTALVGEEASEQLVAHGAAAARTFPLAELAAGLSTAEPVRIPDS
jgi:predicted ATPase/class 3 adenylate cyclase